MNIDVKKIKGYNCPNKFLLLINNEPVAFANSQRKVVQMIGYVQGHITEEELNDGKISRLLNHFVSK